MSIIQLIKKSFNLTLSNPLLWIFGIFLSSGFNLHIWTQSQIFSNPQIFDNILDYVSGNSVWLYYFLGALLLVVGLVIANLSKIVFLHKLHNLVHPHEQCILCVRSKDKTSWQVLRSSNQVLLGAVLAGFITLIVTLAALSMYKSYTLFADGYDLKLILLGLSVGIILVVVSLWNLFTVLFMFWYGLSFSRSAGLSVELLLSKVGKLFNGVVLAAAIFLVSVLGVGWVLQTYSVPSTQWISIVVFTVWLILNNVWFNIVMILLFDDLVKGKKYEQKEQMPFTSPAKI